MIIGRLTTANYEWVTLTNTPAEALENLRNSWESHASESGATYSWEFLLDSVILEPINLGATLTDCARCENLAHN